MGEGKQNTEQYYVLDGGMSFGGQVKGEFGIRRLVILLGWKNWGAGTGVQKLL